MGIRGQYKNKRDANETEVLDMLRAWGIQVEPLDTPFDALCSYAGNFYAVEVKNGPKAPLTPAQERYIARCKAEVHIIRSVEDAEALGRGIVKAGAIPFRGTINSKEQQGRRNEWLVCG